VLKTGGTASFAQPLLLAVGPTIAPPLVWTASPVVAVSTGAFAPLPVRRVEVMLTLLYRYRQLARRILRVVENKYPTRTWMELERAEAMCCAEQAAVPSGTERSCPPVVRRP